MKLIEKLHNNKTIFSGSHDWRFDVLAASLIEQGLDIDRITIRRKGAAKRGISTDIERIRLQKNGQLSEQLLLEIETNRPALYDVLPEGLFHTTSFSGKIKGREEMLEEIRKHRNEEFFIRRFFQLFETEIDRGMVELQLDELKFDKFNSHRDLADLFSGFWPVFTANAFILCKPFYTIHTGNSYHPAQYAGNIQGIYTTIGESGTNKSCVFSKQARTKQYLKLGKTRLGVDFVLRGAFQDGLPDLVLKIEDIPACRVRDFIKGDKRDILDFLMGLLLPADREVKVRLTVSPEERTLRLKGKHNPYPSYLGINSYMK
ncbi:MAG: hypothetical protein LUE98_08850 [Tannerellaceae bacterium]|nr:hypothetical protein [Tannerellaceae bacterium]